MRTITILAWLLSCLCPRACSQSPTAQQFEAWAYGLYTSHRFGLYDRVIAEASDYLQKGGTDKRIPYLRGMSSAQVGDFVTALADFKALGDYVPYPRWQNAAQWVEILGKTRTLLPAGFAPPDKAHGPFRIYYESDSPFTRSVMKLLPNLSAAAANAFRIDPPITTVIITDKPDRSIAIQNDLFKRKVFEPDVITSAGAYLFFNDPTGSPSAHKNESPDSEPFQLMAVDFYTTTLLSRAVGPGQLPLWLAKGITAVAASELSPTFRAENDRRMVELAAKGYLLTLEELNGLQDLKIRGLSSNAAGAFVKTEVRGAEPQTQGFHFVRYLAAAFPRGSVFKFLNRLAEKAPFPLAFKDEFGKEPEVVFAEWKSTL